MSADRQEVLKQVQRQEVCGLQHVQPNIRKVPARRGKKKKKIETHTKVDNNKQVQ